MAMTRSFKELVQRHVKADPNFAEALLREGIDTMLTGDVDTGKAILRDYIKATIGFEKLGAGDRHAAEEPDPHVRPARQSAGQEPVQRDRLSAKTGGRASSRGARIADFVMLEAAVNGHVHPTGGPFFGIKNNRNNIL